MMIEKRYEFRFIMELTTMDHKQFIDEFNEKIIHLNLFEILLDKKDLPHFEARIYDIGLFCLGGE